MKRIGIFLGLTFFLTWTLEFFMMANGGLGNSWSIIALSVVMLIPALSVITTRLVTREGFKDFGLKPHFKGNIRFYLMAWFGPALLILFGALVYFVIFPGQFDPTMSQMGRMNAAQGVSLPEGNLFSIFLIQLALGIFLAPLLNIITTSSEEIG